MELRGENRSEFFPKKPKEVTMTLAVVENKKLNVSS